MTSKHPETLALHAGWRADPATGAVQPPIYQSTSFQFRDTDHASALFIATASTTYEEPYNTARKFASLDLISGGRAGWNVVTTATEAAAHNFNLDRQHPHAFRYARAAEFVDVVRKLWSGPCAFAFLA